MNFFRDFRLPRAFQGWTAPKSLEIDQDNLQAKFSALNVDFDKASFDPLGLRSPPYEYIKFGYPLQNTRFMLLSTNLARERLQIDTDLLHNKHCWRPFWGYQHRWSWATLNPKNRKLSALFAILGCNAHLEQIFAEITGDRPRQPAYEVKLMLSRVSRALAYISCYNLQICTV